MYLIDTNIWLEYLLHQARAQEARQFLLSFDSALFRISDFSLHSIGVILGRERRFDALDQFAADLFINGQVSLPTVPAPEIPLITMAMRTHQLDFDDAYQYVIAKRDHLFLVSLDTDFDHTDLRRQTPAQILASVPPASASPQK